MNSNQIPIPEESLDELDMDEISTVDDFIKELEAKERDLHITCDMTIEIDDSDIEEAVIPDFVRQELPQVRSRSVNPVEAAQSAGLKSRVFELQNDVEELQKRIATLRAERNDVQEKSDRRLKDFENFKYRTDRERRGAFISQISNLASQMLPVLDNLDRALASVENSGSEKTAEFQQFYNGIVLVNQQVNEVFVEMGVQPIATVGEDFDPNFHEAVAVEDREDIPGNKVLAELLRGYRIGNRVIRHSMVKVSTANHAVNKRDVVSASIEDLELLLSTPANDHPDLDPSDDAGVDSTN